MKALNNMRMVRLAFAAAIVWGGIALVAANPSSGQVSELPGDTPEQQEPEKVKPVRQTTPWPLEKVHPAVDQRAQTQEAIDVIVYVKVPGLAAAVQQTKTPFEAEMKSLHQRFGLIENKYRPNRPVPPQEELFVAATQDMMITPDDSAALAELRAEADTTMDQMRRSVGAAIRQAVAPNCDVVAQFISARGGQVTARASTLPALGATIPSDILAALARNPHVGAIVEDPPTEYELNVSVPSAGYDDWWVTHEGWPFDFGIVDNGVQEDHPAFGNVNNFYSEPGSSVNGDHGTHCTGIAVSDDTTYEGCARDVDAVIWANSGPGQSGTMESMDWLASSASQGPEVINHSLGYGTADDTDYSNNDAFYDAFIGHYNIMVTKSTGNGGWDDSDPTITHPAPAYNLMAVANMNDGGTTARGNDVRASSSSVGPTENGRKKPDIAAPGTSIMSTNSDWATENDFISKTGTSMAAPHIAGAIVLMEDAGNHTPMAQKAVLINTADAWSCNNTQTTGDDGEVVGSHWDKSYGWGYVDMSEAYTNRSDYFVDSIVANNYNSTDDDYKLYKGYMFDNEKATLVWQKRADYIEGDPPTTQYDLSDIDIRVYNEANGSSIDSDVDWDDNVHQVQVYTDSDVVIKVYAYDSSFDGANSETYALATEEDFVRADPPSFDIRYNMPTSVPPSTVFTLTIDVQNLGDVRAFNNSVTLSIPAGFVITSGANPQGIGHLAANATGQATWNIRSSSSTGTHTFSATNSSYSYTETYTGTEQDSISVNYDALSNDSPHGDSTIPKGFAFEVKSYDWACVGINPSSDHDIRTDDNDDFSSPYASSVHSSTTRDFIVVNGHSWGSARHYVEAYYGTSSNYTIEAHWSVPDLSVDSGYSGYMPAGDVHEMYEIYLENSTTYDLTLDITSGSGDLSVFVYKSTRSSGTRSLYDWRSVNSGGGGDEQITFTATSTGAYGIAVINENAASANYTLTISEAATNLSDDSPVTKSAIPKDFTFKIKSYDWCGVAINPSTDHDIRIDDNSDFGSPYEDSTYAGTVRDFVVSNGHNWGSVTHYAQVYYGSSSNYTIEAEWEAQDLSASSSRSDNIASGEIIQMYEIYLNPGSDYDLTVDISSGNADVSIYVFKPSRNSGGRPDSDWMADKRGAGGDEDLTFTPATSGYYGIAVINDNASSANYTITVQEATEALEDDQPGSRSETPADYTFQVQGHDWAAVALRSDPYGDNFNVMVSDEPNFIAPYATSTFSPPASDLILTNGHTWGSDTHYARVFDGTPGGLYTIEAQWAPIDMEPNNDVIAGEMPNDEIFDLYELHVVAGRTYNLRVDQISGAADLALYAYSPDRPFGTRADPDIWVNNEPPGGGTESIDCFVPDATGAYALAIVNEDSGEAFYNITFSEVIADFDGDCIGGTVTDLIVLCELWLSDDRLVDLDENGTVDLHDFEIFVTGERSLGGGPE